jgi:hypothetical protein
VNDAHVAGPPDEPTHCAEPDCGTPAITTRYGHGTCQQHIDEHRRRYWERRAHEAFVRSITRPAHRPPIPPDNRAGRDTDHQESNA